MCSQRLQHLSTLHPCIQVSLPDNASPFLFMSSHPLTLCKKPPTHACPLCLFGGQCVCMCMSNNIADGKQVECNTSIHNVFGLHMHVSTPGPLIDIFNHLSHILKFCDPVANMSNLTHVMIKNKPGNIQESIDHHQRGKSPSD